MVATHKRIGPHWTVVLGPRNGDGSGAMRSALHRALERARVLVPEERLATVLAGRQTPPPRPPAPLVLRCSTPGAEVLLATAYVLARDPRATLLFVPAELQAPDERTLLQSLVTCCLFVRRVPETLALLGRPAGLDEGALWLEPAPPGDPLPRRVRQVGGARAPEGRGALASTGCFAAWGPSLWELARRCLPELTDRCEELRLVLRAITRRRAGRREEERVLAQVAGCGGGRDLVAAALDREAGSVRVLPLLAEAAA